jgi:hypothetical protein
MKRNGRMAREDVMVAKRKPSKARTKKAVRRVKSKPAKSLAKAHYHKDVMGEW